MLKERRGPKERQSLRERETRLGDERKMDGNASPVHIADFRRLRHAPRVADVLRGRSHIWKAWLSIFQRYLDVDLGLAPAVVVRSSSFHL